MRMDRPKASPLLRPQTAQLLRSPQAKQQQQPAAGPAATHGGMEGAPVYIPRRLQASPPASEADAIPQKQRYQAWGPQVGEAGWRRGEMRPPGGC